MTMRPMLFRQIIPLSALCVGAGLAAPKADVAPAPLEIRPGVAAGYLGPGAVPDALALLPPPPAQGSAALAADEEANRADVALKGSKRWRLAGMDANLTFPWAAGDFACALNAPVSLADTPHLYQLLRRAMTDAAQAARAAEDRYRRAPPFLSNKAPTCTPGAEEILAQEGSYPSSHATIGWVWTLVLSEISPDQSEAILARGRAFVQGRAICNVAWRSDVSASLVLGAATLARLHGAPALPADIDAAKAELAAARASKKPPQRDCKAEAAALADGP
jgi:acid phosphatase (class A)